MKADWSKVALGGLVGLGAFTLFHFTRPARDRAEIGDKVLVGTTEGGVQSAVKIQITALSLTEVTGRPYELLPGAIPLPITVPRANILSFTS